MVRIMEGVAEQLDLRMRVATVLMGMAPPNQVSPSLNYFIQRLIVRSIATPATSDGNPEEQAPTPPKALSFPVPKIPGLPMLEKASAPAKLESPQTPIARINAIWNKWLHTYASSSQYVEAAVHHYDINHREIPDLVVCTQDSDYKPTWQIVFEGYPGSDTNDALGPSEKQWDVITEHIKRVIGRHKDQSPLHVITACGRWVRFWLIRPDGGLTLMGFQVVQVVPLVLPTAQLTPLPNSDETQTYGSLDIGNDLHVLIIMFYLNVILRLPGKK